MNILCNMCDSIAAQICKMAYKYQKEIETTSTQTEPSNVFWICLTIVAIALIAALTITIWQLVNLLKVNSADRRKRRWDLEDTKRKQIAEYRKEILEYKKDCHLVKDRKFNYAAPSKDDDPYLAALKDFINNIKGVSLKSKNNEEKEP